MDIIMKSEDEFITLYKMFSESHVEQILLAGAGSATAVTAHKQYTPYVKIIFDPDYQEYLTKLVGSSPGTELLKVNCMYSSLHFLGIINTDEYLKATQILLPMAAKSVKFIETAEMTHAFESIIPLIYLYQNLILKGIKSGISEVPLYSSLFLPFKMGEKAILKKLKGFFGKGAEATFLSFGSFKKETGHSVVLASIYGKLFLVDYQQQYIVPEELIVSTITKQCLPGRFTIPEIYGEKEFGGFNHISSSADSDSLYVWIFVANDPKHPLYHGTSISSVGITRRKTLLNAIKGSGSDNRALREALKAEFASCLRRDKSLQRDPFALTDCAVEAYFDPDEFEVEPEFASSVAYPEKVILTMAASLDLPPESLAMKLYEDKTRTGPYMDANLDLQLLLGLLREFALGAATDYVAKHRLSLQTVRSPRRVKGVGLTKTRRRSFATKMQLRAATKKEKRTQTRRRGAAAAAAATATVPMALEKSGSVWH